MSGRNSGKYSTEIQSQQGRVHQFNRRSSTSSFGSSVATRAGMNRLSREGSGSTFHADNGSPVPWSSSSIPPPSPLLASFPSTPQKSIQQSGPPLMSTPQPSSHQLVHSHGELPCEYQRQPAMMSNKPTQHRPHHFHHGTQQPKQQLYSLHHRPPTTPQPSHPSNGLPLPTQVLHSFNPYSPTTMMFPNQSIPSMSSSTNHSLTHPIHQCPTSAGRSHRPMPPSYTIDMAYGQPQGPSFPMEGVVCPSDILYQYHNTNSSFPIDQSSIHEEVG